MKHNQNKNFDFVDQDTLSKTMSIDIETIEKQPLKYKQKLAEEIIEENKFTPGQKAKYFRSKVVYVFAILSILLIISILSFLIYLIVMKII